MTKVTLIHAADLHLDAPFRGVSDLLLASSGGRTGEQLARLLRDGTFIALERLTDLCIRERADALLLAGDVYNSADSSLRAQLALRDAFVRLEAHGVRVFMVHGNHDPLSRKSPAMPWPGNVTVFGRRPETHRLMREGETLAWIHGVSHSGPKEAANLAGLFKGKAADAPDEEVFQIALLHCALTDLSGAHALYAPCSFSDLASAGMDYWALGHVHACRVLDRQGKNLPPYAADPPDDEAGPRGARPFAAYPGSVQGLHVNETGTHGCLLLRVDERGGLRAQAVPLAPIQWETLQVEIPPETTDIPGLEIFLLEELERISPRRSGPLAAKPEPERAYPLEYEPAKPSKPVPANLSESAPAQLSGSAPVQPSESALAQFSESAPAQPSGSAPAQLSESAFAQPSESAPAQPSGSAPAQLSESAPTQPSEPVKPPAAGERMSRLYPPEAVIVRLALAGRTALDRELRKRGVAEDLGAHLNAELEGAGLWIRDLSIEARPLADLSAASQRPDLAGEALRRAFTLQKDPEALALVAEQSLAPLFQRPKARKLLTMPDGPELAGLAEEAALLCLDLLEGG